MCLRVKLAIVLIVATLISDYCVTVLSQCQGTWRLTPDALAWGQLLNFSYTNYIQFETLLITYVVSMDTLNLCLLMNRLLMIHLLNQVFLFLFPEEETESCNN